MVWALLEGRREHLAPTDVAAFSLLGRSDTSNAKGMCGGGGGGGVMDLLGGRRGYLAPTNEARSSSVGAMLRGGGS